MQARARRARVPRTPWITPTVLRAGEPVQMNVMPADAACGSTCARPGGRPRRRSSPRSTRACRRRRGPLGIAARRRGDRRSAGGGRRPRTTRSCGRCGTPTPPSAASPPRLGGVPGATDGTVLTSRGGMPSVVYGPGGKWIAHQADEFVEVADLVAARRRLRRGGLPLPRRPVHRVVTAPTAGAGPAQRHHRRRRHRGRPPPAHRPRVADRHDRRPPAAGHGRRRRRPRRRARAPARPTCSTRSNMVERVDAICLSGGSAYGLAAADGVMAWLAERSRGFPIGPEPHHVVPIVPAAVLFDLGAGGRFAQPPRRRRSARGRRPRRRPRRVAPGDGRCRHRRPRRAR